MCAAMGVKVEAVMMAMVVVVGADV